jgi:hypothetical protein
MRLLYFPSYQLDIKPTVEEELDQLAYREYLIREKICENLAADEEITSPINVPAASTTFNGTYWDKAKSILEVALLQLKQYKLYDARVEASKNFNQSRKVYTNFKNIKALCIKGKLFCCFVSKSRWECCSVVEKP